jgi:ribosomal protein S27AE
MVREGLDPGDGVINMVVWKTKSCPRCAGDLFIYQDMDGWYEQCLQCSFERELKELAEFKSKPTLAGGMRSNRES